MFHRWLQFSKYHSAIVFLAMGVFAALFAWNSYNLITVAMASVHFLSEHGALAVKEGGARQIIEIVFSGYLSLIFYLGFKGCEHELVARWWNRHDSKED
jgi:heme exporter protein D